MTTQQVSLNIPEPIYQHLKRQAEQADRSIEEETLEVLASAVPREAALRDDLIEVLQSLEALDNSSLWNAAQTPLAAQTSAELEILHHKRQREGLTQEEEKHAAEQLRRYERHMLVRAQAAALLKQRGQDITGLLPR